MTGQTVYGSDRGTLYALTGSSLDMGMMGYGGGLDNLVCTYILSVAIINQGRGSTGS